MKPSAWHPIKRWRYVAAREGRIERLRHEIDSTERAELAAAKTLQERHEAVQIAYSMTRVESNELAVAEQEDIRVALKKWGIVIPPAYLDEYPPLPTVLTVEGERWAIRAVSEARRAWLEAWGRTLSPFLTAAISLFSALVSLGAMLVAWSALHRK